MLTWQTSLKALSGAVSYIDISHHESLLVSVSCFIWICVFVSACYVLPDCYYRFRDQVFFQIFGMSMWNYDPDIMDALKGLIISLVCQLRIIRNLNS